MNCINIDEHIRLMRAGHRKGVVEKPVETNDKLAQENMLLRVRLQQMEEERIQNEHREKARVNAERLLVEKMRARRESLDLQEKQRQIDQTMKKLEEEKEEPQSPDSPPDLITPEREEEIKQQIQSNLNKIKEIRNKSREQSKNERLEALSKGKSPNLNNKTIPKKQPSMSKDLSKKLTNHRSERPAVSKPIL